MHRLTVIGLLLAVFATAAAAEDPAFLFTAWEAARVDRLCDQAAGRVDPGRASLLAGLELRLRRLLARDPSTRRALLERLAAAPERGKFYSELLRTADRQAAVAALRGAPPTPDLRLAEGRARAAAVDLPRFAGEPAPSSLDWFSPLQPEFALSAAGDGGFRVPLFGETAQFVPLYNRGEFDRARPHFEAAADRCLKLLDRCPAYDSAAESPFAKDVRLSVTSGAHRYGAFCALFAGRALLEAGRFEEAGERFRANRRALATPRRSGYRLLDRELASVETGFTALNRYFEARALELAGRSGDARAQYEAVAAAAAPDALTLYRLSLGDLKETDPALAGTPTIMAAARARLKEGLVGK